jgi:hypothetical protein
VGFIGGFKYLQQHDERQAQPAAQAFSQWVMVVGGFNTYFRGLIHIIVYEGGGLIQITV